MNIVSVEHLPPLTFISKGKSQKKNVALQTSQQGRNLPPLTLVSNGKVVRQSQPLTIVSKGKAISNNGIGTYQQGDKYPPTLPVSRKGKATIPSSSNQSFPSPMAIAKESKSFNFNPGKKSVAKGKTVRPPVSNAKKPLVLKKYDTVSAPAPFFGPFKSRIPLKKSTNLHQGASYDRSTNETEWTALENLIDIDLASNDIDLPLHGPLVGAGNVYANEVTHMVESKTDDDANVEDTIGIIFETADKAVQTECFCRCYVRGQHNDSDIKQVLEQVAKISIELKELKSNITGKTTAKLMARIFPIKTEADLIKIDYNVDNGENFEIRLKLYLKYLKPKSSTTITSAFKDLIDDSFLMGKNWDGSNNATALNKYTFFETILFDAWKNTMFTKDIYVSAMKEEIKKSHDRQRKRAKPVVAP